MEEAPGADRTSPTRASYRSAPTAFAVALLHLSSFGIDSSSQGSRWRTAAAVRSDRKAGGGLASHNYASRDGKK